MKIPSQGLKFECQQSGNCCSAYGSEGYVVLTESDLIRMENHLGLERNEFAEEGEFHDNRSGKQGQYVKEWFLKDSLQSCRFLKNKKCSVYQARPTQCRTWPFWSDNFNAKTWKKEIINLCPGIGKGKLYSKDEVEQIIKEQDEANHKNS